MTGGSALREMYDRFKDLQKTDFSGDLTKSAARAAHDGMNYLRLVTSKDGKAQRALDDILQYIVHIEHKLLGW